MTPDIELKVLSSTVLSLVETELQRAKRRFPAPFHSLHEAYGVLLEEVEELWAEIKKQENQRDKDTLRREAIDVAAMAIRLIQDLIDS